MGDLAIRGTFFDGEPIVRSVPKGCHQPKSSLGRKGKFGFVRFADAGAAYRVIRALDGWIFWGFTLKVCRASLPSFVIKGNGCHRYSLGLDVVNDVPQMFVGFSK